jgi:hypothetical protein
VTQQKALSVLCTVFLRMYLRRLWSKTRQLMRSKFGEDWVSAPKHGDQRANAEVEAVREILWRASKNDWFEYPMGSRLLYFHFPPCYQHQALSGAPMFYMTPGPTTRRKQPLLAPDEKEVLCKKIIKFVAKGYIGPIEGKIS